MGRGKGQLGKGVGGVKKLESGLESHIFTALRLPYSIQRELFMTFEISK